MLYFFVKCNLVKKASHIEMFFFVLNFNLYTMVRSATFTTSHYDFIILTTQIANH